MDSTRDPQYRQVYSNQALVEGLKNYAARLKGELVRADRELKGRCRSPDEVRARRAHYAGLLVHAEALGTSLAPDVDWAAIRPKVTLAQDYRTTRSDLRIELVRLLKVTAAPLSVNEIHEHIIAALKLSFASKKERDRHRAVVVDALHDLRKGPPSLVDCTEQCTFGKFNQPEQRWFFARRRCTP